MTEYLCTACGYEGRRNILKRGSRGMEIFLWAVLMFPGPFYSAWRMITRKITCPHCGKATMVRASGEAATIYRHEQDLLLFPERDEIFKRF